MSARVEFIRSFVNESNVRFYELVHNSSRPGILPSKGSWTVAVRYAEVAALEAELQSVLGPGSKILQPLFGFAPYRIGASDRPEVVAERALGLCKYLQHVLEVTDRPTSDSLVRLVDEFIIRHQHAGGCSPLPRSLPPVKQATEHLPRHSFLKTLGGEEKPPLSSKSKSVGTRPPGFRAYLAKDLEAERIEAKDKPRAVGYFVGRTDLAVSETHSKVWRQCGEPATRPNVQPFLEPMTNMQASNALCPLCKTHLRKEPCCFRLRTCGHEMHSTCFNDLVRGGRFPLPRNLCPECGEVWAEWGLQTQKPEQNGASYGKQDGTSTKAHQRRALAALVDVGFPSKHISSGHTGLVTHR